MILARAILTLQDFKQLRTVPILIFPSTHPHDIKSKSGMTKSARYQSHYLQKHHYTTSTYQASTIQSDLVQRALSIRVLYHKPFLYLVRLIIIRSKKRVRAVFRRYQPLHNPSSRIAAGICHYISTANVHDIQHPNLVYALPLREILVVYGRSRTGRYASQLSSMILSIYLPACLDTQIYFRDRGCVDVRVLCRGREIGFLLVAREGRDSFNGN